MVTLRTPPSENEDASSAQEAQLDEIELVQQLHYQLECLPPTDTGKHAYLFLLACFILEALVWGECFPTHWHENLKRVAVLKPFQGQTYR